MPQSGEIASCREKRLAWHVNCFMVRVMLNAAHLNSESAPEVGGEPRSSYIRELRQAPRKPKKRGGRVNYSAKAKAPTLELQGRVVAVLASARRGLTIRELAEELGISRQHALYHFKRAIAAGDIKGELEACARNGGLQYRAWHPQALAMHYLPPRQTLAERVAMFLASAA
jgi:hypothetical protein